MDDATVRRYLERIGAPMPVAPTLDALRDLHRRHLETVPFENLSIHLDEPLSLDEAALVDKVVDRRRGGFCYELNGLFAALLRALGFDVTLLAASVITAEGTVTPPFDHLVLMVRLGERYLADVGFGAHAIYPLRLDWPEPQQDPGGEFLVVDAPHGDVDVLTNGVPQCRIEMRPRSLTDFERSCWWQENSPRSSFRDVPRCSRATTGGRITIMNDRLVETVGQDRTETPLATDEQILAAYRQHFGFTLPRVPSPPGVAAHAK